MQRHEQVGAYGLQCRTGLGVVDLQPTLDVRGKVAVGRGLVLANACFACSLSAARNALTRDAGALRLQVRWVVVGSREARS